MSQILQLDKIGTLSHSSGVISVTTSVLTIGGQQYSTTGLSRTVATDVTLVSTTLNMIYAVLNSGIVELRISTNVNSVGPAGFTSWKLVGAFYSNGVTGSIAFGSFVNIKGIPSSGVFNWTPTGTFTSNSTYTGTLRRIGDKYEVMSGVTLSGAPNAAQLAFNPPGSLDTTKITLGNNAIANIGDSVASDFGNGFYNGSAMLLGNSSAGPIYPYVSTGAGSAGVQQNSPFTFGSTDNVVIIYVAPFVGLSNTPLEDL